MQRVNILKGFKRYLIFSTLLVFKIKKNCILHFIYLNRLYIYISDVLSQWDNIARRPMIWVLFVFIGNDDGIGVRRVVASFNKGCRISHWLGGAGPGEGFSRRRNHPRAAVRRSEGTPGVKPRAGQQEGKRFEGGTARWKGGVRLIGSNKVWIALSARVPAHAHARFVYMSQAS